MLIIEVLLGLKSKQGDITVAFIHAYIPGYEKVYVEIPRIFEQFSNNGHKKCLELKEMIYGISQIPRALWNYTMKTLEKSVLRQSKFDPCLFVGEKFTCIVYAGDIIFWDRNKDDVHNLSINL